MINYKIKMEDFNEFYQTNIDYKLLFDTYFTN